MLRLIWYILVGLIAGVIAKSVMHVHMTIFWTIVLGNHRLHHRRGCNSHVRSADKPTLSPFRLHPVDFGAILILFVCIKLRIPFPARWIASS